MKTIIFIVVLVTGLLTLWYLGKLPSTESLKRLRWNKFTRFSLVVLALPIVLGAMLVIKYGAPWIILALITMICINWFIISLFTSDVQNHYYVTRFGKNAGIIRAGSGLHLLLYPIYDTKKIVTEIIEIYYPDKEENLFFGDENAIPPGKTKPYRITTNNTDDPFQKPVVDIPKVTEIPIADKEMRKYVKDTHKKLDYLHGIIDADPTRVDDNDPLAQRQTMEPRTMTKLQILIDDTNPNDEELAKEAENFFKRFRDVDDLIRAVGLTSEDILSNIFGKKLPRTIIKNQEVISVIMATRLRYIYGNKGVKISHASILNAGVPESVSRAIALASTAAANKKATITAGEATAKVTELTNKVELSRVKEANSLAMIRLARENELAGEKEKQLLVGKAEGLEELYKKTGVTTSEEKIHLLELEVLEKVLPGTELTILNGGAGSISDLASLATKQLVKKKKTA